MDEPLKVSKPKVTPSPEVRKVGDRPANPQYIPRKGKTTEVNAEWVHAIQKASGKTVEQLGRAIRDARKKK